MCVCVGWGVVVVGGSSCSSVEVPREKVGSLQNSKMGGKIESARSQRKDSLFSALRPTL